MCVFAHPDDESLATGGVLIRYADEGIGTYLVTATRGERGRFGGGTERPAPEVVGRAREAELLAAAKELRSLSFGPATAKYRERGTLANLLSFNAISTLPTRNFSAASFEEVASLGCVTSMARTCDHAFGMPPMHNANTSQPRRKAWATADSDERDVMVRSRKKTFSQHNEKGLRTSGLDRLDRCDAHVARARLSW